MTGKQLFDELKAYSTEIHTWGSIEQLLHWDQETYMPPGAISVRGSQIALIAHHLHLMRGGPKMKRLLGHFVDLRTGRIKKKGLSPHARIMLREWYRDLLRTMKLPASFVKTFSELTSQASQIWALAKGQSNFSLFAPFLEKIVSMNREKAHILGFDEHPYEAHLALHEPSISRRHMKELFHNLKIELTSLLKKIREAKPIDDSLLGRKFDSQLQMELGRKILGLLPINPKYNRLDLSSHPFSMALHPTDSRITTRLLGNPMSNLFSVLHEAGHAMYEMGLSTEYFGTPLAEAASLSVHESQSRWWETRIGRSYPFWELSYPLMQETFPHVFKKVPLERFYRMIHKVEPSCIRVEADEVTYGLHIILRFEIEEALMEGKLSVADLPEAWNEKMRELLGIVPPNDAMGCLQDIHWSLGDMGYFPTYSLGNLIASQLFAPFSKRHPDWEQRVKAGDLTFIRDWLRESIHQHGRRYNAEELVKRASGKPISEKPYCAYLKEKYREIYDFKR